MFAKIVGAGLKPAPTNVCDELSNFRINNTMKLFCFPYAGSSCAVYMRWKKHLNSGIDMHPVELSGRGARFNEPLYYSMEEAVYDAYNHLIYQIDEKPYAFWGHSMGGLIAYELYHTLKNRGYNTPSHLILSGSTAPHIPPNDPTMHTLPEKEFKEKVLNLGGTPSEIFEEPELLELFLPVIREDFKIVNGYQFMEKEQKMNCNLEVLFGKSDRIAPYDTVKDWVDYTAGNCIFHEFEGNHFFIHDHIPEVARVINTALKPPNRM